MDNSVSALQGFLNDVVVFSNTKDVISIRSEEYIDQKLKAVNLETIMKNLDKFYLNDEETNNIKKIHEDSIRQILTILYDRVFDCSNRPLAPKAVVIDKNTCWADVPVDPVPESKFKLMVNNKSDNNWQPANKKKSNNDYKKITIHNSNNIYSPLLLCGFSHNNIGNKKYSLQRNREYILSGYVSVPLTKNNFCRRDEEGDDLFFSNFLLDFKQRNNSYDIRGYVYKGLMFVSSNADSNGEKFSHNTWCTFADANRDSVDQNKINYFCNLSQPVQNHLIIDFIMQPSEAEKKSEFWIKLVNESKRLYSEFKESLISNGVIPEDFIDYNIDDIKRQVDETNKILN